MGRPYRHLLDEQMQALRCYSTCCWSRVWGKLSYCLLGRCSGPQDPRFPMWHFTSLRIHSLAQWPVTLTWNGMLAPWMRVISKMSDCWCRGLSPWLFPWVLLLPVREREKENGKNGNEWLWVFNSQPQDPGLQFSARGQDPRVSKQVEHRHIILEHRWMDGLWPLQTPLWFPRYQEFPSSLLKVAGKI